MMFHFSSFTLDEGNCTLSKNHQLIAVEPKILSLLGFFCRHPQRAISREELIEKVWLGRIVSNAAINRAVGELRKAIEVDIKDPLFIVTISKVGYQFNATIHQQETTPTSDLELATPEIRQKNLKTLLVSITPLAFIAAILLAYLYYKPFAHRAKQFSVSDALPLTSLKGSAFKQHVFNNGHAVFLHRDSDNKNVQLWLQAPGLPASKLTDDSYYYTFARYTDADTVFATRFNNLEERNCEIIKFTITNKMSEKVADCAKRAITHLAFNEGSRKLYFNFRESVSEPFSIRSIQLDTGRIQQLTHASPNGNGRGDFLFALSPSSKQMAILEYQQDGTSMLKITDLEGPVNVSRFESYYGANGISWFNENTLIITEQKGVIAFELENANSEYLLKGDQINQAVFTAPLSLLSYVKFDASQNIYQLSNDYPSSLAKAKPQEALTRSSYLNGLPHYANTSNALVYISTDSGQLDVQLRDQTGIVSVLNFPETIMHIGNLSWSPDDSMILASINATLFQYSLAKRQWQEIKTSLKNIHFVEATSNHQAIVSSEQSGDWQLWQVDLLSHKANQLTQHGGYSSSYIASTNTVLLSKYSEPGLFELDLHDHSEVTIKEDFKISDWNKWLVRDDNIYFWENQSIIKLNLISDETSTAWHLNESNPFHFTINFDASKLAHAVTDQEKSTIWKRTVVKKN